MMNLLMGFVAFALLVGFLAVLIIHVPRLDLASVITVTVALAAWDLFTTFRSRGGSS